MNGWLAGALVGSLISQGLLLWRHAALMRDRRRGVPLCELHGGHVLTPSVEARLLMNRLIELGRQSDALQNRQTTRQPS